jgi:hypothetical protein
MFNPQLVSITAGRPTRLQFYMLPMVRAHRQVPAPPVGAVPVVTLHALHGPSTVRFAGTPIGRDHRSVVTLTMPPSAASHRWWAISVEAGGHVYPDMIDRPVGVVTPAAAAPATAAPPAAAPPAAAPPAAAPPAAVPARGTSHRGAASWPFVIGLLCLIGAGAFAVVRAGRRRRRRPLTTAETSDPR